MYSKKVTFPTYKLTLHKTYYDTGFFNLGVDVDRFIKGENGPITLMLGESKQLLIGKLDRNANQNGTPRILGGPELRNWFHKKFSLKDIVDVHIIAPDKIWLKATK